MKKRALPFLGMAFLPFLLLGMEMVILSIESFFYGTTDFMLIAESKGVNAILLHWALTCAVWGTGALLLYLLAKLNHFDVFENKASASARQWGIVLLLASAKIIASWYIWGKTFKPAAEWSSMARYFGDSGPYAFTAQYIYYLFESILFLAVIALGQEFGERAFQKTNVPWGGILCGLTWGFMHTFTQDFPTGIYSTVIALFFGVVYLLLRKNVRYAYPVLTLLFIL